MYYGNEYRGLKEVSDKDEGLEEHGEGLEGLKGANDKVKDLGNSARAQRPCRNCRQSRGLEELGKDLEGLEDVGDKLEELEGDLGEELE